MEKLVECLEVSVLSERCILTKSLEIIADRNYLRLYLPFLVHFCLLAFLLGFVCFQFL